MSNSIKSLVEGEKGMLRMWTSRAVAWSGWLAHNGFVLVDTKGRVQDWMTERESLCYISFVSIGLGSGSLKV
jgi:hypothetical protein